MEYIIIGIATSIILPIVYGFFYHLKEKEEKKITYGSEFTVKMSKGITIFFFIWMIICFMGMVGAVVLVLTTEEPNENQMFKLDSEEKNKLNDYNSKNLSRS